MSEYDVGATWGPSLHMKFPADNLLFSNRRRRAYFDDITILVPTSWPDRPEYEAAGREAIDKSDVLVDEPDTRFDQGHRPFVLRNTDCGELGHYMHVTPEYLLDSKVADPYGPYDKVSGLPLVLKIYRNYYQNHKPCLYSQKPREIISPAY